MLSWLQSIKSSLYQTHNWAFSCAKRISKTVCYISQLTFCEEQIITTMCVAGMSGTAQYLRAKKQNVQAMCLKVRHNLTASREQVQNMQVE